jgi:hypothetical protein
MSKGHSRRAILAGIAAAPALVTPAVALGDPSADAKLIERGRQLAATLPKRSAAEARFRTLCKALSGDIGRANNLPADQDDWARGHWEAYYAAIGTAERGAGTDYHAAHAAWNAERARAGELIEEIEKIPAHTIVGLGVKALTVAYAMVDGAVWDDGGDTFVERQALLLVQAVAALSGVTLPPRDLSHAADADNDIESAAV